MKVKKSQSDFHRSKAESQKPTPIWLIDDNKEFCIVFSEALKDFNNIVCTRYFHYGKDAIQALATELDVPAAILLDINISRMNGFAFLRTIKNFSSEDINISRMNGFDILRAIKHLAPHLCIMILTMNDYKDEIRQAIEFGASGYLLKTASIDDVTHAIHTAMQGCIPMDPIVIRKMLTMFALNPNFMQRHSLTSKEKEIIQHASIGIKTAEIADRIQLNPQTVHAQLKNIFHKLDVHTRTELLAKAANEIKI